MLFDKTIIQKIAHLARISLGADNAETFKSIAEDLNRIGDMVSEIAKADTQNIEPMAHPFEMSQRLRQDTITEGDQTKMIMPLAPLEEANLFLVPKVIE